MKILNFHRPVLLVTNGILWIGAGTNILLTGIRTWSSSSFNALLIAALAVLVFVAFHRMFSSMVRKNVARVHAMQEERAFILRMMPVRTWIILIFMMSLGITLKLTGIAPAFFIAFFYCGLGSALTEAGLRYVISGLTFSAMKRED